jgi:hypothetical protein
MIQVFNLKGQASMLCIWYPPHGTNHVVLVQKDSANSIQKIGWKHFMCRDIAWWSGQLV